MKTGLILSVALIAAAANAEEISEIPEGWRIAVSGKAAESAATAYTNNAVRCVWAGDEPNLGEALPANVPFHFAIEGEKFSVSNVQDILNTTCAAIPKDLRAKLDHAHLLGPTLQWFVRFIRGNSTKPDDYLKPANHPAVFRESDFNPTNLPLFASQLRPQDIPPAATLEIVEETYRKGLAVPPTEAGVDYPGTLPETTFATPFGIGLVLRAPQGVRLFRCQAKAWPNAGMNATFAWKALTPGVSIGSWNNDKWPQAGYALVRVDRRGARPGQRYDVAVFAKGRNGLWGAPGIISFYTSPYETRLYANNKEVREIRYTPAPKSLPPFDVTPICPKMHWTDYYQGNDKKQIFGFARLLPGSEKPVEFSNLGEIVLEHHPNETPKTAKKVRYYMKDGLLRFEETGDPISYKVDSFTPRLRGE